MAENKSFMPTNKQLTHQLETKKNQIESKHPMDLISSSIRISWNVSVPMQWGFSSTTSTLFRKSQKGISCFFKLLVNKNGFEERIPGRSKLETPIERKNSILGKRIFSGSDKSNNGCILTSLEIQVLVNPIFLRRLSTESDLSGFSQFILLGY